MLRWRSSPTAIAVILVSLGAGHARTARAEGAAPAAAAFPTATHDAGIPATAVGPASPEEADLLWKEGSREYAEGGYGAAAHLLERLDARYPAYPHRLEAKFILGKSLLKSGKPAEAIAPLQAYASTQSAEYPSGREARMWLGRAHLEAGQAHEAYLDAIEIERAVPRVLQPKVKGPRFDDAPTAQATPGPAKLGGNPALAEALLLQARALTAMNQDERARRALLSARENAGPRPALEADAFAVEILLKTRQCGRFPSARRLSEDQVIDQLDRRGACLLEALLPFRSTLERGERGPAEEAGSRLGRSFEGFADACANPPDPPVLRPVDRSAAQLKRYRLELSTLLRNRCATKLHDAASVLHAWDDRNHPFSPNVAETFTAVYGTIQRLEARRSE
jgi:hypothetical protein